MSRYSPCVTTVEAKKIIGSEAEHWSDEQVQGYIDTAECLKDIFFEYLKSTLKSKKSYPSGKDYAILKPDENESSSLHSSI